jgi:hypothetical protein
LRFQPLIFPWEFRQASDLKYATRKKRPPFTLGPFQKWNQHYIDKPLLQARREPFRFPGRRTGKRQAKSALRLQALEKLTDANTWRRVLS